MSEIRLTKNELRNQQHKLEQLTRYLPTLQLKKAMLQAEVGQIEAKIQALDLDFKRQDTDAKEFAKLLSDSGSKELLDALHIQKIHTSNENIAGVDIPVYQSIDFEPPKYRLMVAPFWWDSALFAMRSLVEKHQELLFAKQKKEMLEEELRAVSIRVNLFEKILIPRTMANIKKIKVFLGDQQLSAVATSKVAKQKVMLKKNKEEAGIA